MNHRQTHAIGGSVGNSDGELVTSLYRDLGLNPSVIPLVKLLAKTSTSVNHLFFNSIYFVCNFVNIYRPYYFIGTYRPKYRRNSIRRYLSPQCTNRIILSVIPLVLGEFLVVIIMLKCYW